MTELFKKCAQVIINSILNIIPDFLVLITKIACSVGAFLDEHGSSIFCAICFLKLFLVYTIQDNQFILYTFHVNVVNIFKCALRIPLDLFKSAKSKLSHRQRAVVATLGDKF